MFKLIYIFIAEIFQKTLLFGTHANDFIFRFHKPRSKSDELLKDFGAIADIHEFPQR